MDIERRFIQGDGFSVPCAIDLRGHGEHEFPLNEGILLDVEAAVRYMRKYGKVVAIGHSLGGRLSLLSGADYCVGLSPAFSKTFSDQTQQMIKISRGYRVREESPDILFKTLGGLPEWQFDGGGNVEIIVGSRDIPEIITTSNLLREQGASVTQIDKALHNDIFLLEQTFGRIAARLKEWYPQYLNASN